MGKEELYKESINNSFITLSNNANKLFDYIGKIAYLVNDYILDNEYKEKYSLYRELLFESIKKKNIREFVRNFKVLRNILDIVIERSNNLNNLEYKLYIDKVTELELLINKNIKEYNDYVYSYDKLKKGLFQKHKEKERFDLIAL